ncbi:MAG: hypothetical protein AB7U73_25460 [Pirellulales bacterium]
MTTCLLHHCRRQRDATPDALSSECPVVPLTTVRSRKSQVPLLLGVLLARRQAHNGLDLEMSGYVRSTQGAGTVMRAEMSHGAEAPD